MCVHECVHACVCVCVCVEGGGLGLLVYLHRSSLE